MAGVAYNVQQVKLGSVIQQIRGVSYKPNDIRDSEDSDAVALLRANNIQDSGLNFDDLVYVDKNMVNPEQMIHKGDIVICASSGSKSLVGKAAMADEDLPYAFGAFCKVARVKEMNEAYVGYFFQSPRYRQAISAASAGANINNIRNEHINEMLIPVYPETTQRRIASTLDAVTTLMAKRHQQLDALDQLVKARFVEMFGDLADPNCTWEKKKLADTCKNDDDIKCGPFGTQLGKDEYCTSGIAVWEIPQINSGFKTKPTHFLTEEKAGQLSAYSIKAGDIAMSRKGNVGRCAVFPKSLDDGIIHSDVLRIRVDDEQVLPVFMMCQLHYSGAVQHQIELVSSGAIMAGINVTKLKQIEVFVPPLELQNQFAAFVTQVDRSKAAVQQSLQSLETLKKSLMQQYFG